MTTSTVTDPPFVLLEKYLREDLAASEPDFDAPCAKVCSNVKGWSTKDHYAFFKNVLDATAHQERTRILMLGVYQGRDLCLLSAALKRYYKGRKVEITGVDAFKDEPCADWDPGLPPTWEAAYGFEPPSVQKARANLKKHRVTGVKLVQSSDDQFMTKAVADGQAWDVIYIDTSHDYDTVHRQLAQVRHVCAGAETLICGDDYIDRANWGVIRAVTEGFHKHGHFNHLCWFSDRAHLK